MNRQGYKINNNYTVYVAMSGGVDSSVAAALLIKQGYNVTGVFMRPWQPEYLRKPFDFAQGDSALTDNCLWRRDREDAMRVAAILGIPLLTWGFSKEYKTTVIDYMIREYKAGRTPNPDVMCNREIKFGLFLKKALKEGADYIATGHYVRLKEPILSLPFARAMPASSSKRARKIGSFNLLQARDKNKDQSYFLWTLKQKQLERCLFPIGDYIKLEVRKLAKKFGLPNHDKKDSQGVCFIGPLNMKDFLKRYIRTKPGKIIDIYGQVIGQHDGVYYYTIGQRHGLNIGNGWGPYYVTGKDIKKNIIYVGKEKNLGSQSAQISEMSWTNGGLKLPAHFDVKIRYRSKSEKAVLSKNGTLKFFKPIRAITPGQSAVFYRGQELIGGGIII